MRRLVEFCNPPQWVGKLPTTGAKGRGLTYERKIKKLLLEQFEDFFEVLLGSWVRSGNLSYWEYRQFDALLVGKKRVYLIEIKLSHKNDALTKLLEVYLPLVQKLYPRRRVIPVQICKSIPLNFPDPISTLEKLPALKGYRVVLQP